MMAEEELARAGQYALFANLLLAAPDPALLELLAASDDPLGDAARQTRVAAVADEFATLFVGMGSGGEVVPYGSWYQSGFLMEEPLAVLRGELISLGMRRIEGASEPEDHIAGLCETMRLLIENEIPLCRQQVFFMGHLASWGGAFAKQLETAKSARFYRVVAQRLAMFLQVEAMAFDMLED